jgi:hypothetical protein
MVDRAHLFEAIILLNPFAIYKNPHLQSFYVCTFSSRYLYPFFPQSCSLPSSWFPLANPLYFQLLIMYFHFTLSVPNFRVDPLRRIFMDRLINRTEERIALLLFRDLAEFLLDSETSRIIDEN